MRSKFLQTTVLLAFLSVGTSCDSGGSSGDDTIRQERRSTGDVIHAEGHRSENGGWVYDGHWKRAGSDGQLKEERTYHDGVRHGRQTTYADGHLYEMTQYVNGVPNGPLVRWFENGFVSTAGVLLDDVEQGEWTYWHPNGQLGARGTLINGDRCGPWKSWHSNGVLAWEGSYKEGERDGEFVFWNEVGQVLRREIWDKGERR